MAISPPVNQWPDARCAKAFWGQHDLPPYRELLADTVATADPQPGQRWLDLGCGGGAISAELWKRTDGRVAEVIGLDCASANEKAYARLRANLTPPPGDRLRFVTHDFSQGLALFPAGRFEAVVSGLSISYAESWDAATGTWTTAGYENILREVSRVLVPGGRFVFSVNVPEPSWGRIAFGSLFAATTVARPLRYLKRSWRMMGYGRWLKREARVGRFHYLPAQTVAGLLSAAGFGQISHRLAYRNQAYVFAATANGGTP